MSDQHAGHPFLRELANRIEDLLDGLRIEGSGHFVEQHDFGPHRQRARDRDTLLLAAREFARIDVRLGGQPDLLEQHDSPHAHFVLVLLEDVDRRHHHILQRGLVREQIVLLKDDRHFLAQRDLLLVGHKLVNVEIRHANAALVDRHETIDAAKESRLAGA